MRPVNFFLKARPPRERLLCLEGLQHRISGIIHLEKLSCRSSLAINMRHQAQFRIQYTRMDVVEWRMGVVAAKRTVTMESKLTLRHVLRNAADFPWNEALFMKKKRAWSLETPCLVWDPDDVEDDNDDALPLKAIALGMDYILGISAVQDIVSNLKQQKPNFSDLELLKAFVYYYKNDAFISG